MADQISPIRKQLSQLNSFSGKKNEFVQFTNSVALILSQLKEADQVKIPELLKVVLYQKLSPNIFQKIQAKEIRTVEDFKSVLSDIVFRSVSSSDQIIALCLMKRFPNESIENFGLRVKNKSEELKNALIREKYTPDLAETIVEKEITKTFLRGVGNHLMTICLADAEASDLDSYVQCLKKIEHLLPLESSNISSSFQQRFTRNQNFSQNQQNFNPNFKDFEGDNFCEDLINSDDVDDICSSNQMPNENDFEDSHFLQNCQQNFYQNGCGHESFESENT